MRAVVDPVERQERYLSVREVARRFGTSVSTIWGWAADGQLPKPVKLSRGCTRWKLSDLERWESSREF